MTRQVSADLTPEAARFLDGMRALEPPADLVGRVVAEVGRTPQQRSAWAAFSRPLVGVAAAAVLVLGAVLIWQFARQQVGPQPTPRPSGTAAVEQVPSLATYVPAAFGHGYLWLEDQARGDLIRFDPRTGTRSDPLPISTEPKVTGSSRRTLVDASSIWVVDDDTNELVQIDPATDTEVRRFGTGMGSVSVITHFVIADGLAWIADTDAQRVITVDLSSDAVRQRFPLPDLGPAQDFATILWVDPDAVWVGVPTSQIVKVDPETGDVLQRIDVPLGAPFGAVAVGDQLLVDGSPALASLNRHSGEVTGTVGDIRNAALPVFCEDGAVWVIRGDQLQQLDPMSLRVTRTITIGAADYAGAVCGDGSIWVATQNVSNDGVMLRVAIGN